MTIKWQIPPTFIDHDLSRKSQRHDEAINQMIGKVSFKRGNPLTFHSNAQHGMRKHNYNADDRKLIVKVYENVSCPTDGQPPRGCYTT